MSEFENPKLAVPRKRRFPKGDFQSRARVEVYRIQVHPDESGESLLARPTQDKAVLKTIFNRLKHLGPCFISVRDLEGNLQAIIHPDSFEW